MRLMQHSIWGSMYLRALLSQVGSAPAKAQVMYLCGADAALSFVAVVVVSGDELKFNAALS